MLTNASSSNTDSSNSIPSTSSSQPQQNPLETECVPQNLQEPNPNSEKSNDLPLEKQQQTASQNQNHQPSKNDKGQHINKNKRNRSNLKESMSLLTPSLCHAIALGKPCKMLLDGSCKLSHDLDAFLKERPSDIGNVCPNISSSGHCRFGLLCRFLPGHPDIPPKIKKYLTQNSNENPTSPIQTSEDLEKQNQNIGIDLEKESVLEQLSKSDSIDLQKPQKIDIDKQQAAAEEDLDEDDTGRNAKRFRFKRREQSFTKSEEFLKNVLERSKREREFSFTRYLRETYPIPGEDSKRYRTKDRLRNGLYLAPLTTVGNLPFRRLCKGLGADVTCGEMALVSKLLAGNATEWALLKRHPEEDCFGVQICGGWADSVSNCVEVISEQVDCDFVDLNMGCPIDLICKKGLGSGLLDKTRKIEEIMAGMRTVLNQEKCLTVKLRTGIDEKNPLAHKLLRRIFQPMGLDAVTLHGRSRLQRYYRMADWDYIGRFAHDCAIIQTELEASSQQNQQIQIENQQIIKNHHQQQRPVVIGNGDVLWYEEYYKKKEASGVDAIMIGRGALIKPWIFTEIKEKRNWDIRSSERLDILKKFTNYSLEHFGSDSSGVERSRRFLLEWLSFLHRYVPVGLLEALPPPAINERPPIKISSVGRDDLEILMASPNVADWVRISEMLLGPTPPGFQFLPKHKSNSYESAEG